MTVVEASNQVNAQKAEGLHRAHWVADALLLLVGTDFVSRFL